jgi:perosamine synthetase
MTEIRIPWAKPRFTDREQFHLMQALRSTWISGGYYVGKFEEEFNRYIGATHGLTVANGTVALHLSMLALGLGPGDEVVVPGYTFVAPGNMAIAVGARPVFVEIDPGTWCIDPSAVEEAIGSRTKAIVAVHIYGSICDMNALTDIARRHRLALIEDAAEAAFSRYEGKQAGTMGDLGCFSFQATKTITMGEGGFVVTRSAELHNKMRQIRDHGMRKDKRYWHDLVGFNFRLTNLQAAVGFGQLETIEEILSLRRLMYQRYYNRLRDVPGIVLQQFRPQVDPVVWAVALRLEPHAFRLDRDSVMTALLEEGIETRPGFYPFGVMPAYEAPRLKIAEEVASQVISLPSYPSLTEDEINWICDELLRLRR